MTMNELNRYFTDRETLKRQEEMLVERRFASLASNSVDYESTNKQLEDTMKLRNERMKTTAAVVKDYGILAILIFDTVLSANTDATDGIKNKIYEGARNLAMRFLGR